VNPFHAKDGELHAERVPLARIAEAHGTPCFVYSRAALEANFRAFDEALSGIPHLVCYAMKANSNLAVLNLFARLGSGFDIVSGGELARVIAAGGDPRRAVFSGVGKTADEIRAGLAAGIHCFNVESEAELELLASIAAAEGARAPVSFRVNPDVDARTHPYISTGLKENKFGVEFDAALPLYRRAARLASIEIRGIDIHIGSQITELEPYREAARKVLGLVDRLAAEGIALAHVDLGGGLGIRYRDESPVALADYAAMLAALFRGRRETLILEPGRRLVGDAGVLLTRVTYLKRGGTRDFAIVDAAMNDLLRPALYDAWHPVAPVRPRADAVRRWQIVGPVCESADFLAHDRELALAQGDLLAVGAAGAYAMAMSSNYNSRPRACEVVVDGDAVHVVRRREHIAELFAGESLLPA
jgi:diaminopimelate decarboxylase